MRTILSSWTAVTHRNNESNYHYSYAVSAAARNCGTLGRGQSDITRGRDRAGARYAAHQIWRRRAYLGGATYTWNNPDFTKGFTLTAMYKYIQKHREPNNFQLTGTWYVHFVKNGLCTFSGFADWWRERTDYADGSHRNFIFLAEPQFWVNLNKLKHVDDKFKLSVGSEVELSQNFGARKGFYAIPTLAIKWSFD